MLTSVLKFLSTPAVLCLSGPTGVGLLGSGADTLSWALMIMSLCLSLGIWDWDDCHCRC